MVDVENIILIAKDCASGKGRRGAPSGIGSRAGYFIFQFHFFDTMKRNTLAYNWAHAFRRRHRMSRLRVISSDGQWVPICAFACLHVNFVVFFCCWEPTA